MSGESTIDRQRTAMPWVSILKAGGVSVIVSMVANLIVRAIGIRVVDIPDSFEPLASAGPVVMGSVSYGVIATIVFAITRYFASDIRRAWLIVSGIGLFVSFVPPLVLLGQDDASGAGVVILLIMHLVAAAVFIPLMLRFTEE